MRPSEGSILVVAPTDDPHAQVVATILEREYGMSVIIWDRGRFPSQDTVDFIVSAHSLDFRINDSEGRTIHLPSLRSVWWRRPSPYRIAESVSDPGVREFCERECDTLFKGAMDASGVPIINDPSAQLSARKPLQLLAARRAGLSIPDTLMSNNPREIRAFWERLEGRCIYKGFTAPSRVMAETRVLAEDDLEDLVQLRHAPIIVQEQVEKGFDVRVNVFGEKVFAACVETHVAAARLDWRLDLTATWSTHVLPETVEERVVSLLGVLGLHYGCIDLRMRPDGSYVFLEINPAGQFLFIEIDTGQPLTRSLAEILVEGRKGPLISPPYAID